MPYLISTLVTGASAVVLLTLLMWVIGPVRRLAGTIHSSRTRLADRYDLLATQIAALRVQLAQRRHPRNAEALRGAPTA
ncbi:MAG TPA: hypothetical protein VJT72_05560 [Pseudonocardiaceae bacterium]|nr:hypothetical protein [Pseudonocardiaceae bacterium]